MAFEAYTLLVNVYPAWPIKDIKALSIRERRYWTERAMWEIGRRSFNGN